jgi:hypothetical protein
VGIDSVGRVGQQLVDGVDAERESASVLVELERREHTVGRLFGCYGALIPVAEGLTERGTVGGKANVVDSPTIHGDRSNALECCLCGFAEALFQPCKDCIEGPVKSCSATHGAVGDAMDDFNRRNSAYPAKQGDAAAFGA